MLAQQEMDTIPERGEVDTARDWTRGAGGKTKQTNILEIQTLHIV